MQDFSPLSRLPLFAQASAQIEDGLAVRQEPSERLELGLGCVVEGRAPHPAGSDVPHERPGVRHRVTRQEPAQPFVPGVAGIPGLVFLAAMIRIDTPANGRFPDPVPDQDEVSFRDSEARPQGGRIERRHDVLGAVAGARQGQQVEEGARRRRLFGARPGERDRDPAFRVEHGHDGRAVAVEIRCQDLDIGRLDVRVLLEEVEKPVVEHFGFPGRRVAGVNLKRPVRRGVLGGGEAQVENVALHVCQAMTVLGDGELLEGLHALQIQEGIEGVASYPPAGCEQFVSFGEMKLFGIVAAGPDDRFEAREDVAPVFAAGIEQVEVELDPLADAPDHVEIGGREGRNGEERHAPGPRRRNVAGVQRFVEGIEHRDPVTGPDGRDQLPPQSCLPVRGPAVVPVPDPLRPVEQAPVEDPCDLLGQFELLAWIAVRKVAADGLSGGPSRELRQDVVEAPPQVVGREGLRPGEVRQHVAQDRPRELRGQLEAVVRGNAVRPGELEIEPPAHGRMRHHHPFGHERVRRVLPNAFGKIGGQDLEAVGMVNVHCRSRPSPRAGKRDAVAV